MISNWIAGIFLLALAATLQAAEIEPPEHAGHALGKVDFPVSCSNEVQAEFNRAVALLHHMSYPQARAAFEHITQNDPHCAMAHFGVAMTLFQPLWPTRPSPKDLARGWAEVQKAKELQPPDRTGTALRRGDGGVFSRSGKQRLLAAHSSLGAGDGKALHRLP